MPPDNVQTPPQEPHSLPPVQASSAQPSPLPSAVPRPAAPRPAPAQNLSITEQTKLLVNRYKDNPYQLSMALQQLKSQYFEKQFGIITDPGKK